MVPVADLAEVEKCIADKAWRGKFPLELEAEFFLHSRNLRMRALNKQTLPLLIICNLFLLADICLLPDTWALVTFLHLGVVSPIIVLLWYVYPRIDNPLLSALADGVDGWAAHAQLCDE